MGWRDVLLAQADDVVSYGELVLKLAAAALPVLGGGVALFQSLRRRPQTANAPKISVVTLSDEALTTPEVLRLKPENSTWIERLAANLVFQFFAGGLYAVYGYFSSDPLFAGLGAIVLLGATGRLLWRIALGSFGEVTTDCVDMDTVISGNVDDIIDICVDAVQRLKGRITAIDRDSSLVQAVTNRGASMTLTVVPEPAERSKGWRRRTSEPGRYKLHMKIQSSKPDAWTAGRNLRLARKLLEHVTGVRWHRSEPP